MSQKRHIGEILLMQETVDAWVLTQTLKAHKAGSQRLVSVLVARAQLDPDDGAMALSEQLGYPAALQRHLERRDPDCQELIPRELIQRWVVLPLGRARDDTLVVVARDPTPILAAALAHATKQSITLAITPELHLEKLIRSIYGFAPAAAATTTISGPPTIRETGISIDVDPLAPARRARTVSAMFNDGTPELPHRAPQGTDRVDRTLVDIDNAITLAAAERFAFLYTVRRWRASLLLDISDGAAIGRRGHGPRLHSVDAIVLPLAAPSIVQLAHDGETATTSTPESAIQHRLTHLLDDATAPAAAAIVSGGTVRAVLAVGDPVHSGPRESVADLARLVDALGAAHDRFSRR